MQNEKKDIIQTALPVSKTVLCGNIINEKGKTTSQQTKAYRVEKVLGSGGFGITYLVSTILYVNNIEVKSRFAIKEHFIKGCYRGSNTTEVVCPPTLQTEVEESKQDFITEAHRLNRLGIQCSNIVKVNEVFAANNTVYYVMEYLDGGSLIQYVHDKGGKLSESDALSILVPVAKAVKRLHADRLLHLDIKPDNIVMKHDVNTGLLTPVLIDFGIAKHFDNKGNPTTKSHAKGATPGYAPLEQHIGISHFAPELDIYALGATLFYMLTGENPPVNNEREVRDAMLKLSDSVSKRTREAVVAAMRLTQAERTPSVDAFLQRLDNLSSLPLNHVLTLKDVRFLITSIECEDSISITYSARKTHSIIEQATTPSLSHGKVTESVYQYIIREFFRKGIDHRGDDGTRVILSNTSLRQDTLCFENDIKSMDPSTEPTIVHANGTTYCYYTKKAPIPPRPIWKKTAGLVLLVLIVIAGFMYHNSTSNEIRRAVAKEDTKALTHLVIDEQVHDALIPLIDICFKTENFSPILTTASYVMNDMTDDKTAILDHIKEQLKNVQKQINDSTFLIYYQKYTTRVYTLSHIYRLETQVKQVAKKYNIPYTSNRQLNMMIADDFKQWVNCGDDTDVSVQTRINCYDYALSLKDDALVRIKKYNLEHQ